MSACYRNTSNKTHYLNYDSAIDSLKRIYSSSDSNTSTINLCALFNKSSWDSIFVILPYLPEEYLDELDMCGNSTAKDSMRYVAGVEWRQGLLFFKGDCVAYYSVVPGNPGFQNIGSVAKAFPVIKRAECEVILVRVTANRDQSFFFFPRGDHLDIYDIPDVSKVPLDSLI
jgi:hypothetical protein